MISFIVIVTNFIIEIGIVFIITIIIITMIMEFDVKVDVSTSAKTLILDVGGQRCRT